MIKHHGGTLLSESSAERSNSFVATWKDTQESDIAKCKDKTEHHGRPILSESSPERSNSNVEHCKDPNELNPSKGKDRTKQGGKAIHSESGPHRSNSDVAICQDTNELDPSKGKDRKKHHKSTTLYESSPERFNSDIAICKDTRESDSAKFKDRTEHHGRPILSESGPERSDPDVAICIDRNESDPSKSKYIKRKLSSLPFYKYIYPDFHALFDDEIEVDLFQKFLEQKKYDTTYLSFCFACRGLKKNGSVPVRKFLRSIHLIYERQVKKISVITSTTKHEIERKIRSNTGLDIHIFDKAQREVEDYFLFDMYIGFLASEFFKQYLVKMGINIKLWSDASSGPVGDLSVLKKGRQRVLPSISEEE